MLLGHWQEMKAIGQAQGALAALAALLPDEAERVTDGRRRRAGAGRRPAGRRRGAGALRRPGAGRRPDRRRRRRARRVDDHRRVPAGRRGRPATGWWPARWPPTRRSGCGSTRSARTPRWPASGRLVAQAQASSGRAQVLADRFAAMLFYIATAAAAGHVRRLVGARRPGRGGRAHRHRAGDRLPARPRPGHPAGDRAVHRGVGAGRHPGQGPAGAGADAHRRRGAVRQDRHADQGRARGHRRRRRRRRTEDEVLRLAAAVEADSEHPLARAIVAAAAARRAAGDGDRLPVADRPRRAGHDRRHRRTPSAGPALLRELDVTVPDDAGRAAEDWSRRGAAVLHLLRARRRHAEVLGAFALEDEVRPEARAGHRAAARAGRPEDRHDHRRRPAGGRGGRRRPRLPARRGRGVRRGAAGRQGPRGGRPAGAAA